MPSSEQKFLNALLSKCFPLLETSTLGIVPAYDVSPHECTDAFLCDGGKGFCFHLFGEVVDADHQKL